MDRDALDTKLRCVKIKQGIAKARAMGRKWGRPNIIETKGDPQIAHKAAEMRSQGFSWSEIASNLGVGRTTARRLVCLCQNNEGGGNHRK